jgi:hypothetical protein
MSTELNEFAHSSEDEKNAGSAFESLCSSIQLYKGRLVFSLDQ